MFSGIRGKFVLSGNVQGRDRVGIVEGSRGYRARGVSIRGKFVLSRNPGYKTRGGRHVAKRSSAPPPPLPGIRTKSSMSALPFTFMLFPHIMFHQTSDFS